MPSGRGKSMEQVEKAEVLKDYGSNDVLNGGRFVSIIIKGFDQL